ncbi:MAG: ABC transporter ATP-binding protein [Bacteroidales bacterium]|jgi:peptide/nickel transport system ATP-binding protein|nr:ABC transporter ATP-binding protein [Bacteroidales bacterium]
MATSDDKIILDVRDLKIQIPLDEGDLTPVRGVDFQLHVNETLGLVGESGCGKSLTCKAILGINSQNCKTSGNIDLHYEDGKVSNLLDMKFNSKAIREIRGQQIAMIFQEPMSAFSPLFTVGHQLAEAVRVHTKADKKAAKELVLETMNKVGIADPPKRFDQHPHEFSGGMLQRALIAMALVCNPRMLIADEPTTALDVTIQAQILELLKKLQNDYGMAILYITHDLGTVAQICDNVAVMYLGRIIEMASVKEIFKNPLHPYTRGLIHSVHKIGGGHERLVSIEGSVPLAMNLENRCGFYDRCDFKGEACQGPDPQLKRIGAEGTHYAACYQTQKAE